MSITAAPQKDSVSVPIRPLTTPPAIEPVSAPAQEAPVTTGGPAVTFQGHGTSITVSPNETILSAAKKHDIPINYECESGRCGFDPVRILSGAEHLNEMDEDEEGWTIEEVCHLKAGEHRLACMLHTTGPIVVEIINK